MLISCGSSLQGLWSQPRALLPLLAVAGGGLGLGIIWSSRKRVQSKYKEDLMGKLPEEILCLILSQLPMKDAVRTCILSKRWRNLYVFIPKLSLDYPCTFKDKRGIMTFIDRFLQLRQGYKIMSFQLSCCLGKEFSRHIERWINDLAGLNIEELELRLSCDHPFAEDMSGMWSTRDVITFPFQLLSKASNLRCLHLVACNLGPSVQGPFKSLLSLRFDAVSLANGELAGIFSACPKLESLTLTNCRLGSTLYIGGPEPDQLKSVTISSCIGVETIDVCAGNLTSLEIICSHKVQKICARHVPKLKHCFVGLKYSGYLPYIIGEVAKDMPQLESLFIESRVSELYYTPVNGRYFNNLKDVYVLLDFTARFDVQQISCVICCSPLLERFRLMTKGTPGNTVPRLGLTSRYDHIHLKQVEIGGFHGHMTEFELIFYLLKFAVS